MFLSRYLRYDWRTLGFLQTNAETQAIECPWILLTISRAHPVHPYRPETGPRIGVNVRASVPGGRSSRPTQRRRAATPTSIALRRREVADVETGGE